MPLGYHTLLLAETGLVAFGLNSDGQLGLGHKGSSETLSEVPWVGPRPTQLDWGLLHSLVLDVEGGVWETGRVRSPFDSILTFQKVNELPPITQLAAGYQHSAALDMNGGLWVWTSKSSLEWASHVPSLVKGFPPLQSIVCGEDFLIGEAFGGAVWGIGANSAGQLGLGHTDFILQPILVPTVGLPDGGLIGMAANSEAIFLIDHQGSIWSAGSNIYGQLGRTGDSSVLQRISGIASARMISGGVTHVLAVDETDVTWVWGYGGQGQLGVGGTYNHPKPVRLEIEDPLRSVLAVGHHSLIFTADGGLIVFGWNEYGQLGLGEEKCSKDVPTRSSIRLSSFRQKSARS